MSEMREWKSKGGGGDFQRRLYFHVHPRFTDKIDNFWPRLWVDFPMSWVKSCCKRQENILIKLIFEQTMLSLFFFL